MKIHAAYPGGNIRVLALRGDTVLLAPDMRDTTIDWFYWSFCVEGAQGKTLHFSFSPSPWVGYFGAAVSHDRNSWFFSETATEDHQGFSYTFSADEARVYFCHDMHYPASRFDGIVERLGLSSFPFTRSKSGNEVPAVMLGGGDKWIVLTSRHHCCESTGTYAMEGMLEEYAQHPIPGTSLLAVPFMDMDGVLAGDPGKCRWPHDHNRDYYRESLYPEVAEMRKFAAQHPVAYAMDLHSPWHFGYRNDTCFNVCPGNHISPAMHRFGEHLHRETMANPSSMAYDSMNDVEANQEWNVETPGHCSFSRYFSKLPGIKMAHTFETAYFGTPDNRVSQTRLIELGHCLMRALAALVEEGTA